VPVTETQKGVQFGIENTESKTATPKADERPSWLPEKFKSPEELAKAYGELEKKQSAPATKTETTQKTSEVSLDSLFSSLDENGALPEEAYENLSKAGISRAVADRYLAGQRAIAAQQTAELSEAVGGEDNFKALMDWAGKNLSKSEISAYNDLIDKGNTEAAKLMLGAFEQKYIDKNGSEPRLVNGSNAPVTGEGGYASQAELLADMRDKRYSTDAAYRARVEARLAKTKAF
jgi:hypothetical protein